MLQRLLHDESGATAIEYALIASMVAIAGIAALNAFGASLSNMFIYVSTTVTSAI